ncbi:MAG: tetratricopeptide repeat protein [Alphaproteobacteria bacterium]|jgi:Tfp pilus assembly protein PilF
MRLFAALIVFALAAPAVFVAAPLYAADDVAKADDVPFREDSGLITAEYYLATGKYMQAIDVLGGVLQRHPQNADAYTYRGYAFQKLGDAKKARESYRLALGFNPRHLGANKYMGNLWLEEGDLSRAMEQLQAMIYVCAGTYCAEVDELQNDINRFRTKKPAR